MGNSKRGSQFRRQPGGRTTGTPLQQQERFASLYHACRLPEALTMAREFTQKYPQCCFAWKALGTTRLESGQLETAREALERGLELAPRDAEIHNTLAKLAHKQGDAESAIVHLKQALELKPAFEQAQVMITKFLVDTGRYDEAIDWIDQALAVVPDNKVLLTRRAYALTRSGNFKAGLAQYEDILKRFPDDHATLSNIGNMYRGIGRFAEGEASLLQAFKLYPDKVEYYSNYLMAMHYNPRHSAEDILRAHRQWADHFSPAQVQRAAAADSDPRRRLRIGMISAGFRIHPVGQMITSSIEALPADAFELFAYSMNDQADALTGRMRARVDQWQSVTHLSDDELERRIRADRIDILLDLCGHTEGNRLLVMANQAAPLQVKWVGGQINTTAVPGIDYMLSDAVETPPGVDGQYTEKLIRLPDDYICYMPRGDAPAVGMLPAYGNGHITFGCFNNPSKVNDEVIARWADILNGIPASRLFLKGSQYDTEEFVERIAAEFQRHGIERQRLIFEGFSQHLQLLDCYNRVDIALDPWPYSGGLTTCEALLMGVPVITLPGPTFAGRHSATHLSNAGLPELVADSWERYAALARDLAGDLESLAAIRRGLRRQLKQSPVCDQRRFSRHLTLALRAIWQRHCAGMGPAALSFDSEGGARFEGEAEPIRPPAPAQQWRQDSAFNWNFQGKVIGIDDSGQLLEHQVVEQMLELGTLELIVFDPASRELNHPLREREALHYYPNACLGDGAPGLLHACLDPTLSATLEPLPPEHLPQARSQGAQVIARLPVNTVQLDDIDGLPALDWLVLDQRNASTDVLKHGARALGNTLLIQVGVAFQATHQGQAELGALKAWAAAHGFRFYRLHEPRHHSRFPQGAELAAHHASELMDAQALFIPAPRRLRELDDNQRMKLAFLLHTVYGIQDLSHELLGQLQDEGLADDYLASVRTDRHTGTSGVQAPAPSARPPAPPPRPDHGSISAEIDRLLQD